MADIFVSYAREDRARIAPFVDLLEQQGWHVWWDREVVPGHSFARVIDSEIAAASCVVVFWSRRSVDSDWVQSEANEGLERNILIPIMLDDVRVPLIFRRIESVPLLGWPDKPNDVELQRTIAAIAAVLHRRAAPVTTPPRRRRLLSHGPGTAIPATIIIAGLIVYLAFNWRAGGPDATSASLAAGPPSPTASIAVMPFSSMTTDIAPELAHLLSSSGSFFVQNPGQVEAYLNDPTSVKLDARYSLQGTVEGSSLMVSLFDRRNHQTLWDETFDLERMSLPAVTQHIASGVANAFSAPAITFDEVSSDAYIAYLQGEAKLRGQNDTDRLNQAKTLFLKAIDIAPRFAEAYAGLCETDALMYKETRSTEYYEDAERRCFRAQTLSDRNIQVDIALGKLYRMAGRYDAATDHLEAALKSAPFSTDVLRELALVRYARHRVNDAVALLELARQREPNYWENYELLATIYFEIGQYKKAARQYEAMRDLVTDKARVLNDVGSAWYLAEDFDRAIDAWQASLAVSETAPALSNLGSAYYFNGDFEKALQSFEKAVRLRPNDARYWANAGDAALQTKEDARPFFRKAVALGKKQLAINPGKSEVLSLVASSYAGLGEKAESLRYIDKAMSLGKNDIYVLYDVAVAYARLEQDKQKDETLGQMIAIGYSKTLIQRDANFNTRRE